MILHLLVSLLLIFGITANNSHTTDDDNIHSEPHIRQIGPWLPNSIIHHSNKKQSHEQQETGESQNEKQHPYYINDNNNADNEVPVLNHPYYVNEYSTIQPSVGVDNGAAEVQEGDKQPTSPTPQTHPPPIQLPFVNRPLQVTLLAVIMTAAVFANGSVIANISRDSLKLRMVHFLLICHVCIADCLGAMVVLPVPLVAIYQPALALCIPNVPLVFFIIVFAGYCIGLVSLTTGYVLAFARRRRRKRNREKESKLYAELCDNTPFANA